MAADKRKKYGKAVRISQDVKTYLEKRQRGEESYDAILRRLFGIPDRKGNVQELRTYFVVPNGAFPVIKTTQAEARGESIIIATKKGIKKAESVITVQELP